MDIRDILQPSGAMERPDHPDMFRLLEIATQLRADVKENTFEDANEVWHRRVREIIDFDSLAYQALQLCLSVVGIETAADFRELQRNDRKREQYVTLLQAYYDGFIMGALFEQRGGHQDG